MLFASDRDGYDQIYRKSVQRDAPAELVVNATTISVMPGSCTADGRYLAYIRQDKDTREDIYVADLMAGREPEPFLVTPFHDAGPAFSPAGDWIAYASDNSGRWQVYLRRFPSPANGQVIQVSNDGGMEPVWSRDGEELYFRSGDAMMAVEFKKGDPPDVAEPVRLFEGEYRREWNLVPEYDVYNGEFLMVNSPYSSEHLVVSLNWFEHLTDATVAGAGPAPPLAENG